MSNESGPVGVAYVAVAAVVGHVVICVKAADYTIRGIEWMGERLEQRRAAKRSKLNDPSVIDAEFTVIREPAR